MSIFAHLYLLPSRQNFKYFKVNSMEEYQEDYVSFVEKYNFPNNLSNR